MDAPQSPESRFSNRVADYVRYRPGYPSEVPTLLQNEVGLLSQSIVADVGSGTGISTDMLLKLGCEVFAVEPNAEMRAAAECLLEGNSNFHSVAGSAHATTLADGSIELIVAAQAFHWFKPVETRVEFDRILKPGGHVVLIWNERKLEASPFLKDYEALLMRFGTDYATVRHENIELKSLGSFFRGDFETHVFSNFQRFDFESLKGRLMSSSYAPAPGHPQHEPMLGELRRIFDLHQQDGRVDLEYATKVHIGR